MAHGMKQLPGTSEEIGKILREKGFDVNIVNVKEEKVKNISEYDLIVVASGMRMGKWVSEAEAFLKKFRKEFEGKNLALFVSTMKTVAEREGKAAFQFVPERRPLEKQIRVYAAATTTMAQKTEVNAAVIPEQKTETFEIKKKVWYCKQCGYVVFREDPPYVCPICKAKRELFAEIRVRVDMVG